MPSTQNLLCCILLTHCIKLCLSGSMTCNFRNNCSNSIIQCQHTHQQCIIQCANNSTCVNTYIQCPTHNQHKCYLECTNNSCLNITVNATYSHSLSIDCNGSSCKNMSVYCPSYAITNEKTIKQCNITYQQRNAINNDEQELYALQIYAKNSWNDFNLRNWTRSNQKYDSIMHCGESYKHRCVINRSLRTDEWNCINESSQCFVVFDQDDNGSNSITNGLDVEFILIITSIFIGCHVLLAIICLIWYQKTQRYNIDIHTTRAKTELGHKKRKQKYLNIQQNDDPLNSIC